MMSIYFSVTWQLLYKLALMDCLPLPVVTRHISRLG
jgi:hypothetical protein